MNQHFTFVDLFAGIGGFHLAMHRLGGECVFASEINKGNIVIKNTGDCVAFHLIDLASLKTYLYENIKMDTPSTTRHRHGQLFVEKDGQLYFKLNLQLRF